eukprot:scaffold211626_cov17-Prasinocladus_malaysianus.AAC.1
MMTSTRSPPLAQIPNQQSHQQWRRQFGGGQGQGAKAASTSPASLIPHFRRMAIATARTRLGG